MLKQTSDVQDVCFLKCELSDWVNAENQYDWHYILITEEERFRKAKRILIPWLRESHWTVFHFDSYRNIIEYFDSKHNLPSVEDVESISDFLKVSFQSFYFDIKLINSEILIYFFRQGVTISKMFQTGKKISILNDTSRTKQIILIAEYMPLLSWKKF